MLLITIYVGIQMDTSFIKVTVLAEHISTSFYLSWEKSLFENNLGQGQICFHYQHVWKVGASKKRIYFWYLRNTIAKNEF